MDRNHLTLDGVMALSPCAAWPRERVKSLLARLPEPTLMVVCSLPEEDVPTEDIFWLFERTATRHERGCYAAACAEHVLHIWMASFPEDDRFARAIAAGRNGGDKAAADAARAAAAAAAWAAAWAAESAAWAAARAPARAAAWAAARAAAWDAAADAAADAARAAESAERAWQRKRLLANLAGEIPWEAPASEGGNTDEG